TVPLVQVDDGEAADAELRREHECAAERERPEPAVPERAQVGELLSVLALGPLSEHEHADSRPGEARETERREPPRHPARVDDGRHYQRDEEAGERDRRLTD